MGTLIVRPSEAFRPRSVKDHNAPKDKSDIWGEPHAQGPRGGDGEFGDPSGLPVDDLHRARLVLIYADMYATTGEIHYGQSETWAYQPTRDEIVRCVLSLHRKSTAKARLRALASLSPSSAA